MHQHKCDSPTCCQDSLRFSMCPHYQCPHLSSGKEQPCGGEDAKAYPWTPKTVAIILFLYKPQCDIWLSVSCSPCVLGQWSGQFLNDSSINFSHVTIPCWVLNIGAPSKCLCWKLTHSVMILGGGSWLGQKDWDLPSGMCVLMGESLRAAVSLLMYEDTMRTAIQVRAFCYINQD